MSSEEEQIQQRRANLTELARARRRRLSAPIRAHRDRHGSRATRTARQTGPELEEPRDRHDHERPHSRHSQLRQGELSRAVGRPVAHPGLHQEGLAVGARLRAVPAARFRRRRGRGGASVPHAHQRADDLGVAARVSREVPPAAAREVARPDRRRDPLSPALSRSHRQSRGARGLPGPQQGAGGAARVPGCARLPRSRDADDAADCRRRHGAAVPDASQRARHRSVPAHRARAVPEAAGRRRPRARLRDQPQLPQRRHLDPAQPRVHDARVLSGLQRLPGPDDADGGDDRLRGQVGGR